MGKKPGRKRPAWFSIYSPPDEPSKPPEPQKVLRNSEIVEVLQGDDRVLIEDLLKEGITSLYLEHTYDDYDHCHDSSCGARLHLYKDTIVPNKNYDKELQQYEKKKLKYEKELAEHQDKLKEWERLKKEHDQVEQAKKDKAEKAEYERLKKKYGND